MGNEVKHATGLKLYALCNRENDDVLQYFDGAETMSYLEDKGWLPEFLDAITTSSQNQPRVSPFCYLRKVTIAECSQRPWEITKVKGD